MKILFHPHEFSLFCSQIISSSQPTAFFSSNALSLNYHLEYTVMLLGFYSCILLLLSVASSAVSWVTGLLQSSEGMHLGVSHRDTRGAQAESHRVWVESGPLPRVVSGALPPLLQLPHCRRLVL